MSSLYCSPKDSIAMDERQKKVGETGEQHGCQRVGPLQEPDPWTTTLVQHGFELLLTSSG